MQKRSQLTETATYIASLNIVINRMHFKRHVDSWCQKHCNPAKVNELEKVSINLIHLSCIE